MHRTLPMIFSEEFTDKTTSVLLISFHTFNSFAEIFKILFPKL